MSNLNKESFYLNQISALSETNEYYRKYTILPQYGSGTYTIYEIMPGIKLSINEFAMKKKTINESDEYETFSKPILKINYCIDGKMLAYNRQGKACIAGENSIAYFTGKENIFTVEHFNKNYKSITLCGYIDEIIDILNYAFQIKPEKITKFCKCINNKTEFVVASSNKIATDYIYEIIDAINKGENDKLRIKAIELLLFELRNIDTTINKKHVYYNRVVIDKIRNVHEFIINNLDEKITVKQLSNDFDISLDTLKRGFKKLYSKSVYSYIKKSRLQKGKKLLQTSDKRVTEIALICGYSNHHSFSKAFKEEYKITPREVRKTIL
ncbi:AraC family transcriptional regulator [Clostridiaceae bacterium M8S5]|nr:AraC family transcriptional regulator [Clostridiaceae bacterium M8S5]